MKIPKKIYGISVLLMIISSVSAEEVKMYLETTPSAEEMGSILFAEPKKPEGARMRSINFTPQTKAPSIGLPIKFGFDSAQILNESMSYVDEIGRMLNLAGFTENKLIIEGHTDSRGSKAYNRSLSNKRATAVKRYLMDNYNIAANRLFVSGLGESEPLAGVPSSSSVNRRVQFRKAP